MIRLTQNDWRIFRCLQRKHNVSTEFLRYNLENIQKFIWYETWPRIVIKRYAIRKGQRVFIVYYRLRRVLFDQSNRKLFKRMRQNVRQWSKRMVQYQKNHQGVKEYVEEVINEDAKPMETEKDAKTSNMEDVSKQLKEQLELLKNSRRQQTLIINSKESEKAVIIEKEQQKVVEKENKKSEHQLPQTTDNSKIDDVRKKLKEQLENIKTQRNRAATLDKTKSKILDDKDKTVEIGKTSESPKEWQINLESTPKKQITTQENTQPVKQLATDEKTEKSHTEDDLITENSQQSDKIKTGLNFLDMLMCKVAGGHSTCTPNSSKQDEKLSKSSTSNSPPSSTVKDTLQHHSELSLDSTDGFLGFDDCERLPGMLMTPIVPHSTRNNKNSAFVSESLNEYMRVNDLETNYSIDKDKSVTKGKIFARYMEGLMTPRAKPPPFDMPAVPENLLKFRTVAERKQYLQKFSKNYRLSIINNEGIIYRELQRKIRIQKVKSASQQLAQSANSSMSFTRNGWHAASFINTEFNNFYYQMLDVDHGTDLVRLKGVRGNNDEFHKTPYISKVLNPSKECPTNCVDEQIWQDLKPIKTITSNAKKLNKDPLPAVFKPCPLSHKPFQKPLDDDTAALLLAGGSMAVVRMPTVELEVFPEQGKPLHEIAKRYLQYILPHHDISREWAEFSVSTLQQPSRHQSIKEVEQAAAKKFNPLDLRKSYTFVIPYLNDRSHILVRRVVDRSEKLDQSFEKCLEDRELVPKTDFTFRRDLDESSDDVLLTCADVVSDMINTVAISCSENSFIKNDPDGLEVSKANNQAVAKQEKEVGRPQNSATSKTEELGPVKKSKQRSLLKELKRLNATIIDAAVKPEIDNKPCSKDFCSMGCICISLTETQHMREHCGKTKCMLECTCKSSNQSRIMRLETDGRTITTEDAFMLRRKATARLARMEKEFTSTIVLTENETLLINETNNDKKRRCTKAPKRYEDFADTDDERRISPKKATEATASASALTTIDNENSLAVEVKELREPVYVQDSILEQLKHCTVNLVPLQDMENVVHWCMIHNLYKCFCKGRAVEGKPMIIEKEEVNTTIEHGGEQSQELLEYSTSVKAKYTFDKVEKRKKSQDFVDDDDDDNNGDDDDDDEEDNDDSDKDSDYRSKQKKYKKKDIKEKPSESLLKETTAINDIEMDNLQQFKSDEDVEESIDEEYVTDAVKKADRIEKQKPKRSLLEVRKRFYLSRLECCRRQIPIPRRMFLYCNRKRRLSVLQFIKKNENEQTRLLLNEHIMRSVYYHKIDAGNQKKTEDKVLMSEELGKSRVELPSTFTPSSTTSNTLKRKFLLINEVVDLLEDEEVDDQKMRLNKDIEENTQLSSSTTKSCTSFEKLLPDEVTTNDSPSLIQISNNSGVVSVKKCTTVPDVNIENPLNTATNYGTLDNTLEALKMPKISSCFSLNAKANLQKTPDTANVEQQHLDFTSATTVHSAAFSQPSNQQPHHSQSQLLTEGAAYSKDGSVFSVDMNDENIKDVYNSVIKTMNSLVSKKMQDIDFALKRESRIIPAPNADILCIMKWSNFLEAFCEGFAYIWQVKMNNATYFVATIRNMMPMIEGALGIVNITALKADKMPLLGRMLLHRIRNTETLRLAIVMQGKISHWVVKGFLRAEPTTACNKPTPETHPSLTKKINVLCSLLVKQRQRDEKKKEKEKEKIGNQWTGSQIVNAKQKIAQIMPTPRASLPATQIRNSTHMQNSTQIQNQPIHMQSSAQNLPEHMLVAPNMQNSPHAQNSPHMQNSLQMQNSPHVQNLSHIQNSPHTLNSSQIRNLPHIKNSQLMQNSPQTFILPTQIQNSPNLQNLPLPQQSTLTKNDEFGIPQKNINKTIDNSKESLLQNAKPSRKRKSSDLTTTTGNSMKMDFYAKMNSNVEFRKVSQSDINEIHLPELHRQDHKWLVLDLHNDFSHIFVPEFQDLVSLDRIQKVINFAKQKKKIVKLQFFRNAPFDAFVTPKSGRKIYFGPLTMDMKPPTLILLQSVDGQMMLRELYQLQHNIKPKYYEKTKAFWLLQLKGHTHFEVDLKVDNKKPIEDDTVVAAVSSSLPNSRKEKEQMHDLLVPQETSINQYLPLECSVDQQLPQETTVQPESNKDAEDDDEDCMIVNETVENVIKTPTDSQERYNFTIKSVNNDSMVSVIPKRNSLPGPPPIQTLKTSKSNNIESNLTPNPSILNIANNTKTSNASNSRTTQSINQMPIMTATSTTLPLLTLPHNTVITGITPKSTMEISTNTSTLPVMKLPTNAVITGITQAPHEAPYGSTIFISSTGTATTSTIKTATSSTTNNINLDTIMSPPSNAGSNIKTSKPMAQIQPEVQIINPDEHKKSNTNQNFEAAPIKRRRISLFCSKKYDKMSQNIAVDAVLKKIIPENAEDVQINPLSKANEVTTTTTNEVVSTIGSTTIKKITDKNSKEVLNIPSNIEELSSITSKMKTPIVFDVNFMDDGDDEPTASIVIKPTKPEQNTSLEQNTIPTQTTSSESPKKPTPLNTPIVKKIVHMQSVNQKLPFKPQTVPSHTYKIAKIPNNTMAAVQTQNSNTTNVTSTNPGSSTILNKLLSSNATMIKPQLKKILPRPSLPASSSNTSAITPRSSLPSSSSNIIPMSRPSIQPASTITSNSSSSTTKTAAPIPLKLHKILNSSSSSVKIQTATTLITKAPSIISTLSTTLNQQSSPAAATAVNIKQIEDQTKPTIDLTKSRSGPTITIKQVQDMLTKSSIDLTTTTTVTTTNPTTLANINKQTLPNIKAVITPANSVSPQISSSPSVTRTPLTSSSSSSVTPTSITSHYSPSSNLTSASTTSTTVINSNTPSTSTMSISKVQSFGSSPKQIKDRTTTNVLSFVTPSSSSSQTNNKKNNEDRLVNPPAHIQYGYIVSAVHASQKFVAKRVAEEFYVKVPLVGIVKLQGSAVNNYLNRYMDKNSKDSQSSNANWRFVAASKDVQMQNHQKSLLVRKTKPSTTNVNSKKAKVSSTDEPILIDD